MQLLQILSLCVTVLSIDACSLPSPNCPDLDVKKEFDVAAYSGLWYEISRVPNAFQKFGECVTATYTLDNSATAPYPVEVVNRQFNRSLGVYESRQGGAKLVDSSSNEGKLLVFFPPEQVAGSNYWVLDTDYTSYSVVFSCNEYGGVFTRSVWILSRKPTLSDASMVIVDATIARNMLDRDALVPTRQDAACLYD